MTCTGAGMTENPHAFNTAAMYAWGRNYLPASSQKAFCGPTTVSLMQLPVMCEPAAATSAVSRLRQ